MTAEAPDYRKIAGFVPVSRVLLEDSWKPSWGEEELPPSLPKTHTEIKLPGDMTIRVERDYQDIHSFQDYYPIHRIVTDERYYVNDERVTKEEYEAIAQDVLDYVEETRWCNENETGAPDAET